MKGKQRTRERKKPVEENEGKEISRLEFLHFKRAPLLIFYCKMISNWVPEGTAGSESAGL